MCQNSPDNCTNIVSGKDTLISCAKLVGYHNPRDLIRGQSTKVGLRLSVLISLHSSVSIHLTHLKIAGPTYFTLVINTIAINIHIGNPNKGSTLFTLLIVTRF